MGATELLLLTASLLGADDVTMLEFTADWCSHCQTVAPTVGRLETDGFPIVRVNADTHKDLLAKHRVRALPTFIVLKDGRELRRAEGELSYDRLVQLFESAGYRRPSPSQSTNAKSSDSAATVRGQSPRRGPGFLGAALDRFRGAAAKSTTDAATTDTATTAPAPPAPRTAENNSIPSAAQAESPAPIGSIAATPSPVVDARSVQQRAMQASVRLRIEDADGFSFGSGTIIDTHGEDALVLTCGHIFRDSNGKGRIEVQIFTPQGMKTVEGSLLTWEPDYHDIGLVAIRPGVPVNKATVASSKKFAPHDQVFSIGCDRGADPSLRTGRIASLNRFQGAPNIEVTGKPTVGRSGGGLFDSNGQLIGVCKLANPTDDEGIYASLESIHHHLNKTGLKHVYQPQPATDQLALTNTSGESQTLEVNDAMLTSGGNTRTAATRASSTRTASTRTVPVTAATDPAGDSEVIVIVRSKSNPQGKSQVMVLDQADDELLEAIERAVNRNRRPATTTEAIRTADRRTRN